MEPKNKWTGWHIPETMRFSPEGYIVNIVSTRANGSVRLSDGKTLTTNELAKLEYVVLPDWLTPEAVFVVSFTPLTKDSLISLHSIRRVKFVYTCLNTGSILLKTDSENEERNWVINGFRDIQALRRVEPRPYSDEDIIAFMRNKTVFTRIAEPGIGETSTIDAVTLTPRRVPELTLSCGVSYSTEGFFKRYTPEHSSPRDYVIAD